MDEALRKLLEGKAEVAITVESIVEMLAKLDTVAPVTMVEVVSGNLVKCAGARTGRSDGILKVR